MEKTYRIFTAYRDGMIAEHETLATFTADEGYAAQSEAFEKACRHHSLNPDICTWENVPGQSDEDHTPKQSDEGHTQQSQEKAQDFDFAAYAQPQRMSAAQQRKIFGYAVFGRRQFAYDSARALWWTSRSLLWNGCQRR